MSADIAYRLLVDLSTRGTLAPQLDRMQGQARTLDSHFGKLKDSLSGAIGGAAGMFERAGDYAVDAAVGLTKLAAAGAGAAMAYGVMRLNNELEQTKISIGAILNAQGVAGGIGEGMSMASGLMKDMRKDARELPGELKDLQGFFKLGATSAFQLGATPERLEKMSANAMAAAAATGVNMDQAAREFAMLLQGRAGSHNIFGNLLGLKAEEFNSLTGDTRLKAIETAVGKYQSSIEVFGNSFDALSSTMRDNAKQTLQQATAPLFEHVKMQLSAANNWFDDHRDKVEEFAERVGDRIAYGFEFGRMKIQEWTPAIVAFAENAGAEFERIWAKARPIVEGFERIAKGVIANPESMAALEHAGLLYGGLKVGKAAAPILSPLMGMFGGGGAAGAGGLAEMAAAAGPAILGLGTLAVAAEGAAHLLTDSSATGHAAAVESVSNTAAAARGAAEQWDKFAKSAQPLVDLMGLGLLKVVEQATEDIEAFGHAVNFTVGLLDRFNKATDFSELLGFHKTPPEETPQARALFNATEMLRAEREDDTAKTKKGAGGGGGGTHIQKVEIVVSSNQDPSRIARLTADEVLRLSRFGNRSNPASTAPVR